MGDFLAAFFESLLRGLSEYWLSKKPKFARNKEPSFKEWLLILVGMAIFLALIHVFWALIFKFVKALFIN